MEHHNNNQDEEIKEEIEIDNDGDEEIIKEEDIKSDKFIIFKNSQQIGTVYFFT
jgi:hypothetical protein